MLKLRAVLLNSKAAIDLASIMVGIIVIGLIGGVIAATVFAVIPWAQDSAAKQQLESIHTAQNAAFGFSADPSRALPEGQARNSFTNSAGLEQLGLLAQGESYCTTAVGKDDYRAYSKSSAGKIWFSSNGSKQAQVLPVSTPGLNDCKSWVEENVGSGTTPTNPTIPGAGEENENPTNPGTPETGEENENPTNPGQQPVIYGDTSFTLKCETNVPSIKIPLLKGNGTAAVYEKTTGNQFGEQVSLQNNELAKSYTGPFIAGTEYKLVFDGTFLTLGNNNGSSDAANACFRSMDSWATDAGTTSATNGFKDMNNLTSVPQSIPYTVTQINNLFLGASSFNQNLNSWDVKNVVNLDSTFNSATRFNNGSAAGQSNSPLIWNTSKVTALSSTFSGATSFNQNINDWDTSSVIRMSGTFFNAKSFNQPLDKWDVSKSVTTQTMFSYASAFNQNIGNWKMDSNQTVYGMFNGATNFNQNLTGWNVKKNITKTDFSKNSALTAENLPKW